MSGKYDARVDWEVPGLQAHGLYLKGSSDLRSTKPLVVLIHGGGTNAQYFDNRVFSIPQKFSTLGFDVLNINRPGYGGNALPTTPTPIKDSIPLYVSLIKKAYDEHSTGNGIVLVGHSLGALTSLCIAAYGGEELPLLGISALGIIPAKEHAKALAEILKSGESERFIVEPSPETIETFMGPDEFINFESVGQPGIGIIFEPGVRREILEWFDEVWYERFTKEVAPAIKIPLQFMAAEYEIQWRGVAEGRPIFEHTTSLFTKSPRLDAKLLLGGGHNFEFTTNASTLHDFRVQFIESLVKPKEVTPEFDHIPLLDFSLSQNPSTKAHFLKSLREAIVNVGFFYIKNTSVNISVQEALVKKGIELLNLPSEEKMKIKMANSKHFLGYAELGNEITAQRVDFREQFDFATEVPAPGPDEPLYRNLRGPNQWPAEIVIPGLRDAVEDYLSEISTLSLSFNALVAEALELPSTAFDKFFDVPQQNKLKLVKYPPPHADVFARTGGAAIQGVGPHKDGSFLTYLLQGTNHHGLEIQNKAGSWIAAPPIPGTLVINIGRSLEALTGGICTATTHRVNLSQANFISPSGEPLGPRYSFPIFQGVQIDLTKDKIDLKIPQHIKDLVKDEKARSEAESTFDAMFGKDVGEAVLISRITSHQDVGARWYPDLLEKALQAQRDFTTTTSEQSKVA